MCGVRRSPEILSFSELRMVLVGFSRLPQFTSLANRAPVLAPGSESRSMGLPDRQYAMRLSASNPLLVLGDTGCWREHLCSHHGHRSAASMVADRSVGFSMPDQSQGAQCRPLNEADLPRRHGTSSPATRGPTSGFPIRNKLRAAKNGRLQV